MIWPNTHCMNDYLHLIWLNFMLNVVLKTRHGSYGARPSSVNIQKPPWKKKQEKPDHPTKVPPDFTKKTNRQKKIPGSPSRPLNKTCFFFLNNDSFLGVGNLNQPNNRDPSKAWLFWKLKHPWYTGSFTLPLEGPRGFLGYVSHEKKKHSYFPLNPGCLMPGSWNIQDPFFHGFWSNPAT